MIARRRAGSDSQKGSLAHRDDEYLSRFFMLISAIRWQVGLSPLKDRVSNSVPLRGQEEAGLRYHLPHQNGGNADGCARTLNVP